MSIKKHRINITVKKGRNTISTGIEGGDDVLKEMDEDDAISVASKAFTLILQKYADYHPEIESILDFFNNAYEVTGDKLEDAYKNSVSRESVRWLINSNPSAITSTSMSLEDFQRFLEQLEDEDD